jgi:biopolymer transport protein ExbD
VKVARKKSEPVKETQMVSLADIAFLIIFFFMLSSQFMKDRTTVKLPDLPTAAETKSQNTVSMDINENIRLNGDEITDAADLESKLRPMLAGKTKPVELEVRFRGDRALKYKNFRPIYEAISNAGGVIAVVQDIKR